MERRNLEKRKRVMQRSMRLGHCICDPKLACPCDLLRAQDVCLCAGEQRELPSGPVRLTQLVEKTGCSSKIDQATLRRVLSDIVMPADPRVLVGAPAGDDAGVFHTSAGGPAWVQTVDVFSPCVDDPYLFGQIAAANSLSDIYAMGAVPMTALSIIGFPARELPDAVMRDILRGGVDKMTEAGVNIIGGHSINDREIKAGFAVTGLVQPDQIMTNAQARPGDVLVLTKPIGTGILSFAAQIGRARADSLAAAGRSMAELNRTAAEIMLKVGAHACTDVTGFGLIGHLAAMASASGVDVELTWDDVPLFDGVLECAAAGMIHGSIERNRESSQEAVIAGQDVTALMLDVLFDPQTSGGLLISLPERKASQLLELLRDAGISDAAMIGRVVSKGSGRIHVRTTGMRKVAETSDHLIREHGEDSIMSDCGSGDHGGCCSGTAHKDAAGASSAGSSAVPEIQKKFQEFLRAVNQPGALDAHTKQAICLALAVLAKCDPCVRAHIAKARDKGFTEDEIDEAAWLAISFGGAPLMMFYNGIRKEMAVSK